VPFLLMLMQKLWTVVYKEDNKRCKSPKKVVIFPLLGWNRVLL